MHSKGNTNENLYVKFIARFILDENNNKVQHEFFSNNNFSSSQFQEKLLNIGITSEKLDILDYI